MNQLKASLFSMVAAALLIAANVSAAECTFSTECEGNQVCEDGSCTASTVPQHDCSGDTAACGWGKVCDQGVCKPEGVLCANDWGQCTVWENGSECNCADGSGQGSSSASDGSSDGIDMPEPEPIAPDTLYEMCTTELEGACSAPPDLSEVCTDDSLASCTDYLTAVFTLEGNCQSDEPVGDPGDNPVSEDTAGADDAPVDAETAFLGDTPVLSPWYVADCCEQWPTLGEDEATAVDCILGLSPDDCDGYKQCAELFIETPILGSDREDADDVGNADKESAGDVDEDGADTEGGDLNEGRPESMAGSESSGCSFVAVSRNVSALDLIYALF